MTMWKNWPHVAAADLMKHINKLSGCQGPADGGDSERRRASGGTTPAAAAAPARWQPLHPPTHPPPAAAGGQHPAPDTTDLTVRRPEMLARRRQTAQPLATPCI